MSRINRDYETNDMSATGDLMDLSAKVLLTIGFIAMT